jgi:hypothetical protein
LFVYIAYMTPPPPRIEIIRKRLVDVGVGV